MSATRKITVELPEDIAARVAQSLADGVYESESAIVTASLAAQLDSNDRFETWSRTHLRDALAEWRAAPEKVKPAAEVFDGLLARYEARKAREA